ncbi:Granzyme B [Labeo rohita]|uniref:Granzyme B n=1 Tax=Labeo rohita TaxID=84645 RepID=A0ABQ8L7S5_LABRO|nr:Granzyme B [Labeo rohita]
MVIFSLLLLASLLPHATCIVNGWEAKPHSRPYMVTQAVTVVLGAHNLRNKNENSVRIKVESYHTHPQYTSKSFHNDILLLRLEKNARLNNNIKLISIPAKEGDIEADSVCSIAGWGLLETKGKQSNHLMETNVTVMNNKECECKWGEEEFSASLMMCVYGEGGSCDGDSGGPLVCGDTAVGVTSFGDPKISRVNVGIVNGKEAKPHSRPYMVTQALTVVLGAHNLQNKNENSVRIKVKSYHTHPQYTSESFRNDILLLRLEKNAQLNNNIKSISIPAEEGDIEADSVCSIAGWGLLETNGKQSNHLMETNVKVVNNKECESKWGEEEFSASLMMCVYGEGGSCDGDSRGILVYGDTAVGVTSFGDPEICNSPERPEECQPSYAGPAL